jgi:uncharacterized protein
MEACIENGPAPAADADEPVKLPGLWRVTWSLLLYLIVIPFAIAVVFGIFHGFDAAMHGHAHHPGKLAPRVRQVMVLTSLGAASIITFWYVRRHWRATWRDGSLQGVGYRAVTWKPLLLGAALGILTQVAGGLVTLAIYHGHPPRQAIVADFLHMPTDLQWLALPLIALLVPVIEETLFRGVLLAGLVRHMSIGLAATLATSLFVLAHLPGVHGHIELLTTIVLLAAATMWLRLRYRSIYPGMAAHMACNAFLGLAMLGAHP